MKKFEEIVAEFIAKGHSQVVAETIAGSVLAELQAANSARIEEERKKANEAINADGLPCELKRGRGGALLPCCPSMMVVLKPAAPSKTTGAEFGPSLKLHFAEHVNEWGKITPQDHWIGGQSTSSIEPPEVSGTWQLALALSQSQGVRYFSQEKENEAAKEMTASEWLEEVQAQCSEFMDDIAAVRSSVATKPVKRRRS